MKMEIYILKNIRYICGIISCIAFFKILINLKKFYDKKEKKIFRYRNLMFKL